MNLVNTFGIDFIARTLKNDKSTVCLFAKITVNGESKELSLKTLLDPKDWDSLKEVVRWTLPEVKAINKHIDNVRFRLQEEYRLLEDKKCLITAKDIKDAYLGNHSSQRDDNTLCRLMTYHAEQMVGKLSPGTLKNYVATEQYVKAFIKKKYKREDIFLVQLDVEFITELETFIPKNPIKKHNVCTANGTAKHIERVKKMVSWAKRLKWIKIDPFEDFTPFRVKVHKPKLKMFDVMQLESCELIIRQLDLVKDMFEFACYTGLAYADLMEVEQEDFFLDKKGRIWCIYHRRKTKEAAGIPLLKRAMYIIGKYKDDPRSVARGKIFPYVSNQEMNRCLKLIQEHFKIPISMTFHLARHTFATTMMLKSGVPLETVSKMLGHAKISTTQVYAEVDEETACIAISPEEFLIGCRQTFRWAHLEGILMEVVLLVAR